MSQMLVVLAPLMLLLLWFYYGVNSNGVTAINSITMVLLLIVLL